MKENFVKQSINIIENRLSEGQEKEQIQSYGRATEELNLDSREHNPGEFQNYETKNSSQPENLNFEGEGFAQNRQAEDELEIEDNQTSNIDITEESSTEESSTEESSTEESSTEETIVEDVVDEKIVFEEVDNGPISQDDTASGSEDSVISGNVLSNDSNIDGNSLNVVNI